MVCDSIWVTNAPEVIQVERLIRKRGMNREQALERIHMQSAQSAKVPLRTSSSRILVHMMICGNRLVKPGRKLSLVRANLL
jgi:hypothetical protein